MCVSMCACVRVSACVTHVRVHARARVRVRVRDHAHAHAHVRVRVRVRVHVRVCAAECRSAPPTSNMVVFNKKSKVCHAAGTNFCAPGAELSVRAATNGRLNQGSVAWLAIVSRLVRSVHQPMPCPSGLQTAAASLAAWRFMIPLSASQTTHCALRPGFAPRTPRQGWPCAGLWRRVSADGDAQVLHRGAHGHATFACAQGKVPRPAHTPAFTPVRRRPAHGEAGRRKTSDRHMKRALGFVVILFDVSV